MADQLVWKCVACGFDIADGDGWVQVRMSEVMDREDAVKAWQEKYEPEGSTGVSLADLAEYPDTAPWRPLHSVCDATGGEAYSIGVEDLRTPWGLVKWTAHLMEKTWLGSTDWDDLLRRSHEQAGIH